MENLDKLIIEEANWKAQELPNSLYHYTTSAAFLNIIKTGELWFTDYKYLNDSSELRYGIELFKSKLVSRHEQETDFVLKAAYAALLAELDRVYLYIDIFIFSLCKENNLLNQWRVYGQNSAPISIEFAVDAMRPDKWENYGFDIVPMIYDPAIQNQLVEAALSTFVKLTENGTKIFENDMVSELSIEFFVFICADLCMKMKHPQFEVEGEWRLVVRCGLEHQSLKNLNHRSTLAGIVPYLTMKPCELGLPIVGVTVGPCHRPEQQEKAIFDFLKVQGNGYEFAKISISELPIRSG